MLRWIRRSCCLVLAMIVLMTLTAAFTGTSAAFGWTSPRSRWAIGIDRWAMVLNWQQFSWNQSPGMGSLNEPDFIGTAGDNERDASLSLPGVRIYAGHSETNFTVSVFDPSVDETSIVLRHWLLGGISFIFLLSLLRFERCGRSRRRRGLCGHCGYDLRGTPDRCPECGLAPA